MKDKLTFEERFDKLMESFDRFDNAHEKAMKEIAEIRAMHRISAEKSDKENAEIREMQNKTEQDFAEIRAKNEKLLNEKFAETDRLIKANAKQIGGISSSNGYIVEDAIFTAVNKNMTFADVEFDYTYRNLRKHKKSINKKGEYDIVLVNCELLTIIEAKYKVNEEDVEKLATSQIEKFRLLFPEYQNHKIILGIGGMGFEGDAFDKAKQLGVIPIRVLGEEIEYDTEGMKMF